MAYDQRLADRLRDHLRGEPGLSEQRMFGGLAFLVHGNMAVAASAEGGLLLRHDPARTDELLAQPHTDPFVMRGRRMAGWIRILPEGTTAEHDLARWADLGVGYARSLPPK